MLCRSKVKAQPNSRNLSLVWDNLDPHPRSNVGKLQGEEECYADA